MMSLIPAMLVVTFTITIAFASFGERAVDDRGTVMGSNLTLHHKQSVAQAMEDGRTSGYITSALGGPFRQMGDWTTQVVSSGHRTVVVTYLPDGIQGAEQSALKAFSEVTPLSLRKLPESYAGNYKYSGTGTGGTIGRGDFSDMVLPIPANGPAIITVINQDYTGPGGPGA